ncbi:hypothetical protein MPTK1_7g16680 [Marchantia polymorpha subsp. ruderalis]|uniref:Uncharacterized protein n=2 Tax=Marchantia polymorpha TaxID=3197 RepID=A0AAF6C0G0_MARPO|nr:hypothetical protein MARPO_0051s0006 [Marchantia polymorpha]BBN17744.1 hypothetical protein Mp_7g16680 [Marchantia polymorpha subsp. ruderalis]|eukprot:PTQ38370.1 hypothetical protein MARPO_0051s0006 [Marchantia polymorpha]
MPETRRPMEKSEGRDEAGWWREKGDGGRSGTRSWTEGQERSAERYRSSASARGGGGAGARCDWRRAGSGGAANFPLAAGVKCFPLKIGWNVPRAAASDYKELHPPALSPLLDLSFELEASLRERERARVRESEKRGGQSAGRGRHAGGTEERNEERKGEEGRQPGKGECEWRERASERASACLIGLFGRGRAGGGGEERKGEEAAGRQRRGVEEEEEEQEPRRSAGRRKRTEPEVARTDHFTDALT